MSLLQHRMSTNLSMQPSGPATPENDTDDSSNPGFVADLGSVKSENGGRGDGQKRQDKKKPKLEKLRTLPNLLSI